MADLVAASTWKLDLEINKRFAFVLNGDKIYQIVKTKKSHLSHLCFVLTAIQR